MSAARRVVPTTAAALSLALLAGGCRRAPEPKPAAAGPAQSLASRFAYADVRTDSLDLAFLVAGHRFPRPMWQEPRETREGLVAWTQGEAADVVLPIASRSPKVLVLRARCYKTLGPRLPMDVLLNAKLLGSVMLTTTDAEFRFDVPSQVQALPDSVLRVAVPRRFVPAKGVDARPAAVAVTALELRPVGESGPILVPSVKDARLLLPPGSDVGFFLRHHAGAELAVAAAATRVVGRLDITLETQAGRKQVGSLSTEAGRTASYRARLEAPEGAYVRLGLSNRGDVPLALSEASVRGVVAPSAAPLAPTRLDGKTSVVIFLVDTLRADRLGAYGFAGPSSPAFDAFARESIVFDDVWAQAPWTRPTVASIFTGLHAATHGAGGFDRALPDSLDTMAELMQRGGYRTGAVVANHVVNARFGFAQGFEVWNDGEEHLYGLPAADVVARGLRFIDKAAGPFFLYLHTLEPHAPYEPSDASWAPFRRAGEPRRPSVPILMRPQLAPDDARYLDSLYQGEILDDDHAFGALVEGLRSRGLLDKTLVLFTADHGEEFLDHGGKGHGHTLYRELIRVPLGVRLPGGRRGGVREAEPVAQVDLLPTLAALLGLPAPKCEGRDLSSLWLGRARPGDPPELVSETRFGKAEKSALRIGALQVIVNADPRRYGSAGGPLELYDVRKDPSEHDDLAGRDPFAARFLANRLAEILRGQRLAQEARGDSKVELSAEDREALKALGYVQ